MFSQSFARHNRRNGKISHKTKTITHRVPVLMVTFVLVGANSIGIARRRIAFFAVTYLVAEQTHQLLTTVLGFSYIVEVISAGWSMNQKC